MLDDDRDEDERAGDLSEEGLPVLVEAVFACLDTTCSVLGILGGQDRDTVVGHLPGAINFGAQGEGSHTHAQKCAN